MWMFLKESYRTFHLSMLLRTQTVTRHQGSKHPVQPHASVMGVRRHCWMFAQTRQLYQQLWSLYNCEPWKQDSSEVITQQAALETWWESLQGLQHRSQLCLKFHSTSWGRPCISHPSLEVSSVHSLKAMRARITAAELTWFLPNKDGKWSLDFNWWKAGSGSNMYLHILMRKQHYQRVTLPTDLWWDHELQLVFPWTTERIKVWGLNDTPKSECQQMASALQNSIYVNNNLFLASVQCTYLFCERPEHASNRFCPERYLLIVQKVSLKLKRFCEGKTGSNELSLSVEGNTGTHHQFSHSRSSGSHRSSDRSSLNPQAIHRSFSVNYN